MSERDEEQIGERLETSRTAAEVMLRSLRDYGVEYIFGNFGTDHPPFLEAAAKVRETGPEEIPEFVVCPHETVALSSAHGYAAATGKPQAVIVHVDVGTQNMGAMVHNAHRGNAPVLILAGLAPVTHHGHKGSRDSAVHHLQDIYDQPGIVRQFCRWTGEYRTPADPDEYVARGLEVAATPPKGPAYLSASREALESPIEAESGSRSVEGVDPTGADAETISELASRVATSETPLVVTSKLGADDPKTSVMSLVEFAEAAGAGVVEPIASSLCFPRTHELHVGFDPTDMFEHADLVILADSDVPWRPTPETAPPSDLPVIQIDIDPTKPSYPQWDLRIDRAVRADAASTFAAITDHLDPADGEPGREKWQTIHEDITEDRAANLAEHRKAERLTSVVLTDAVRGIVDDSTTVLNETTTNIFTVMEHLPLDRPGSYFFSHGSGLGWALGASIGVKLARPQERVISLVGDGTYLFGQPSASAWVSAAHNAPTLTVIYNNRGWNAVRGATLRQHPEGKAAAADVPESKFDPGFNLSHAAHVVDAHTEIIESTEQLEPSLEAAVEAVDSGTPSVLDVRIEPI